MPTSSEPHGGSGTTPDVEGDLHLRMVHPVIWWLTLVGPPLFTLLIVLAIWILQGASFGWRLVSTAVATFFFLGKFVVLAGVDGDLPDIHRFLTREELFAMVVYMDMATVLVLTFHLDSMFRLPVVGSKLKALAEDGRFILATNPWMRRVTFVGLVAFVVFPLASTGSVGASIFGRLLGMTRVATVTGVAIGSVLGGGIMYFGAELIHRYLDRDNPWLVVGGVAVLASLLLLLNHRYRQHKRRYLAMEESIAHSAAPKIETKVQQSNP